MLLKHILSTSLPALPLSLVSTYQWHCNWQTTDWPSRKIVSCFVLPVFRKKYFAMRANLFATKYSKKNEYKKSSPEGKRSRSNRFLFSLCLSTLGCSISLHTYFLLITSKRLRWSSSKVAKMLTRSCRLFITSLISACCWVNVPGAVCAAVWCCRWSTKRKKLSACGMWDDAWKA